MILSEDEVELLKREIGPVVMSDWDSRGAGARSEAQGDLFHLLLPLLNELPRELLEDPSQASSFKFHEEALTLLARRRCRIMAYRGVPIEDVRSTFSSDEVGAAERWVSETVVAALRILSPSTLELRRISEQFSSWDAEADLAKLLREDGPGTTA